MCKKLKLSFVTVTFNSVLLVGTLLANVATAAECGQAKLLSAGSAGVSVTNNECNDSNRIAVGSMLELSTGSRLWLKFDPSAKGETIQLICQNKSSETIKLSLATATEPWIKPEALKSCTAWKNNKLSCETADGGKNSFFCAVASTKSESSSSGATPEQTTSVRFRDLTPRAISISADEVIDLIKPEIELCKGLYNVSDKLEMSWTVSVGKIHDLTIASDNKDLVSCVEDVIKQTNANQDLSIKHSF